MKKMHIAFYKAKYGDFSDKLIDWGSGKLGYSHCEFVINPTTMIGAHYTGNGVAKFYYNDVYNSKLWDVYELDLPKTKAKQFMHDMVGTEYDSIGVALHFVGLHYSDKEKVWCSEVCAMAINRTKEIEIPTLEMPNDLVAHILELGGKKLRPTKLNASNDIAGVIDIYGRVKYGTYR